MDGQLGMTFSCPVCGQVSDGLLDFMNTASLTVTSVRCQARFKVDVDGTVTPPNRQLPPFRATIGAT